MLRTTSAPAASASARPRRRGDTSIVTPRSCGGCRLPAARRRRPPVAGRGRLRRGAGGPRRRPAPRRSVPASGPQRSRRRRGADRPSALPAPRPRRPPAPRPRRQRCAFGQPAAGRPRRTPGGGDDGDAGQDAGQQQCVPRSHGRRQHVADRQPRRSSSRRGRVSTSRSRQQRRLSGGQERPRACAWGALLRSVAARTAVEAAERANSAVSANTGRLPTPAGLNAGMTPRPKSSPVTSRDASGDDRSCPTQSRRHDRAVRSHRHGNRPQHRRRMVR